MCHADRAEARFKQPAADPASYERSGNWSSRGQPVPLLRLLHQPHCWPLFCSSSHFCSGAKYSRIALASMSLLAGQLEQRVLPRLARAQREHLLERGARVLVAVDRALVERAREAGLLAQRAVELELEHRARGSSACTACSRRRDTSRPDRSRPRCARSAATTPWYFSFRSHQCWLYLSGLTLPAEHVPAPLVDHQAERQERDLLERDLHLLVDRRLVVLHDLRRAGPSSSGTRASSTARSCRRSPHGSRRSRRSERGSGSL